MQYVGTIPRAEILVDLGTPYVAGLAMLDDSRVLATLFNVSTRTANGDDELDVAKPVSRDAAARPLRSCAVTAGTAVMLFGTAAVRTGNSLPEADMAGAVLTVVQRAGTSVSLGGAALLIDDGGGALPSGAVAKAPTLIHIGDGRIVAAVTMLADASGFLRPRGAYRIFQVTGTDIAAEGGWTEVVADAEYVNTNGKDHTKPRVAYSNGRLYFQFYNETEAF